MIWWLLIALLVGIALGVGAHILWEAAKAWAVSEDDTIADDDYYEAPHPSVRPSDPNVSESERIHRFVEEGRRAYPHTHPSDPLFKEPQPDAVIELIEREHRARHLQEGNNF